MKRSEMLREEMNKALIDEAQREAIERFGAGISELVDVWRSKRGTDRRVYFDMMDVVEVDRLRRKLTEDLAIYDERIAP